MGQKKTAGALLGVIALFSLVSSGCARFHEGEIDFDLPETAYVHTDRGRTFVLDRGEGPAVLLVHGYGAAHDLYLPLMERLIAEGYRVLAIDLPGCGRSDRRPGDYSPEGLASHLVEILNEKGVDTADVIGHSWGSSIVLRLALDHPDRVGRLVLTSAWVYEEQLVPFISWSRAPGIGEMLYTAFYRERAGDRYELSFFDPDRFVTQEAVDMYERALNRPGTVRAALAAARAQRYEEIQRRYGEVTAQSLLVWGRQDRVSRPHFGSRLEAQLPNARLVLLDRCGHIPMVERAARYEAVVLDFLGPASAMPSEVTPPEPSPPSPPAPAERGHDDVAATDSGADEPAAAQPAAPETPEPGADPTGTPWGPPPPGVDSGDVQ